MPHKDLLALPCPQAWPFSLLLVTDLGERARARGRGASRLVLLPAGLSPPSLRSAAASASGTRHLSTLGFWKHPLNPGSFPLGGVAVTDRTPPTEHRAPAPAPQSSCRLATRCHLGARRSGHRHMGTTTTNRCPRTRCRQSRPPCQDGCCPQGRGNARGGALHAGVGLMRPGAGPVPSERLPQTLAEASGPNPPTQHTGGIARRPCADAVVHPDSRQLSRWGDGHQGSPCP